MKFTITIPPKTFAAIEELAREQKVRIAVVINALIRRGIISGFVKPLVLFQDEYQFKRELKAEIARLDDIFDEWFGLQLEDMEGSEIAAIAKGERPLPPDPWKEFEEEANRELEEVLASGCFDDLPMDDDPHPLVNTAASTEEIISQHLKAMDELSALINQKLAAAGDDGED